MNRFSREATAAAASNPFAAPRAVQMEEAASAPAQFAAGSPEDARRLLDEVQQLGSRMRINKRRSQQIDRRAAAYASRLARHVARLLDHMPSALPMVKPVPGTGASALRHYILEHHQFHAPDRTRLLVVSSDGRLRVCTVLGDGKGTRLWTDYEVVNPPAGLGLSVVFDRLSSMIARLETVVNETEAATDATSGALDGMIAQSESKLSEVGSRLQPVENLTLSDEDVFGTADASDPNGLKSYGFEHRIAYPQSRPENRADAGAAAKGAAAPAPSSGSAGRFAR